MARPVLKLRDPTWINWKIVGLLMAFSAAILPPAARAEACRDIGPAGAGLVSQAKTSPLYHLLHKKLGPSGACRMTTLDDNKTLVLKFARSGSLTISVSEMIETSVQAAALPASVALSRAEAVKALRAVEQSSAPPKGCGIVWSTLARSAPKAGDIEADGAVCNCKAGLHMDKDAVVGLTFSSAC